MRARERRTNVESELASDDPTDLDDMVFSNEEESREVIEEELWKLVRLGLDGVWVFHTLFHRWVAPLAKRS